MEKKCFNTFYYLRTPNILWSAEILFDWLMMFHREIADNPSDFSYLFPLHVIEI